MTLTVGRCSGLRPRLASPSHGGTAITIAGTIPVATVAEVLARRQQLLGLVENVDEPAVPVTWVSDASIDGYYAPLSATVEQIGTTRTPAARFSLSLARLVGFGTPLIESAARGVLMANSHSIASATVLLGTPKALTSLVDYPVSAGIYSASTETGDLLLHEGSYADLDTRAYTLAPGDFYAGAATVEVQYPNSSTWFAVVGRQLPAAPVAWRLNNGMIRLSWSASNVITLAVWNGSTWETSPVTFAVGTSGTLEQVAGLQVLRNSPEMVVVRLGCRQSATPTNGATVDLALRRGAHHVAGVVTTDTTNAAQLRATSTSAATSIGSGTSGLRQTSNDANGNRWVMASPVTLTRDTTNGRITPSSFASPWPFMLGIELDGSSSTAPFRATDLLGQYFGAVAETQRVVAR